MLQTFTLKFLKELNRNNNKPWFDEHRKEYENARKDFNLFIDDLIKAIAKFDKSIAGQEAKNCIFRINRDVRFSKNKNPYKNNMAGYFNKDGKKGIGAGYYFHLEPGASIVAGGIWMPEPFVLGNIRQEIDYNFEEWKKIIGNTTFKRVFPEGLENNESLLRPPKGYDIDNRAIHYLKMKTFIVTKKYTDKEILSKSIINDIAGTFRTIKPVIDFLNRATD